MLQGKTGGSPDSANNLSTMKKTDVLIIGGPGGTTAAMFLPREGIKPLTAEYVRHRQRPSHLFSSYLPTTHPEPARRIEKIDLVKTVRVIPELLLPGAGFCGKALSALATRIVSSNPSFSNFSTTPRRPSCRPTHCRVSQRPGLQRCESVRRISTFL